jgi:hypothetical protein
MLECFVFLIICSGFFFFDLTKDDYNKFSTEKRKTWAVIA